MSNDARYLTHYPLFIVGADHRYATHVTLQGACLRVFLLVVARMFGFCLEFYWPQVSDELSQMVSVVLVKV